MSHDDKGDGNDDTASLPSKTKRKNAMHDLQELGKSLVALDVRRLAEFDLPERLIASDPSFYLRRKTGGWGSAANIFDPRAFAEYERCFAMPETIHATCEDYRAAASIDLEHDDDDVAAGRKVTCPLLVLWGANGVVHRYFDPVNDWRAVADDVRGRALPSGHYLAEEVPEETLVDLLAFFAR